MLPPATPEALTEDIDEVKEPEIPKGLQRAFSAGEYLPWKGIRFKIEMVTPDAILLKPVEETWQHKKLRIRGA